MIRRTSRRDFLRQSAMAGVAGSILRGGSSAFGAQDSPNGKVRFACIGVGGKGDSDTSDAGKFGEIVALCDCDEKTLDKMAAKFPNAKKYVDYRKMLEEMGDKIDAVTVSTPDHTHAPAGAMAMRMGKHAFIQKPLTWSVEEARILRALATEKKLCTQMGNQGTAADGFRRGVEVIRSGTLGARSRKSTSGPTGRSGRKGMGSAQGNVKGIPNECPLVRVARLGSRSVLTIRPIIRSPGEAGSTSALVPSATWPVIRSTSPRWP